MAFDTVLVWNISDKLFKNATCEEEYRSATNRAYYSAYHECSRIAKKFNYKPPTKYKNFKHRGLHDILINHNKNNVKKSIQDTDVNKLGYLLKQSKDLRAKADYDDANLFTRNQASDALAQTSCILKIAASI